MHHSDSRYRGERMDTSAGGLRKLFHNFIGEDIVAAQSLIAPDSRIFTNIRGQIRCQILVESCDPAERVVGCGPVVGMCVADEEVLLELRPAADHCGSHLNSGVGNSLSLTVAPREKGPPSDSV